jgi:hypothetical protein
VFELHENPVSPWSWASAEYGTPLEYMVTPQNGGCDYDGDTFSVAAPNPTAYLSGVVDKYSSSVGAVTGLTDAEEAQNRAVRSVFVASSQEANDARARFARGMTTTYTETLKRPLYRAALVTSQLQADSFSGPFKAAAEALANNLLLGNGTAGPSGQRAVFDFILEWGDFVMDSATLGASLYRTMYADPNATDTVTRRAMDNRGYGKVVDLVAKQDMSWAVPSVEVENGVTYGFDTSRIFRLGEFDATDEAKSGPDICSIGNSIRPQVRAW